ncbi:hypothetical protein ElyMa_005871200 [Elysia marginata]|uniref:Uncharacterized protein n=1 Tax=Elysia marginata TaxID=1093978 RepID=A0AAV4G0Q8_9GAST|nr:hypothetical protein ElyMa_005871200 [Elysia marginata]
MPVKKICPVMPDLDLGLLSQSLEFYTERVNGRPRTAGTNGKPGVLCVGTGAPICRIRTANGWSQSLGPKLEENIMENLIILLGGSTFI